MADQGYSETSTMLLAYTKTSVMLSCRTMILAHVRILLVQSTTPTMPSVEMVILAHVEIPLAYSKTLAMQSVFSSMPMRVKLSVAEYEKIRGPGGPYQNGMRRV